LTEHKIFIIAEAGVNHNGSLETALALVDAAADAGADAVKFQTFRAGNVVSSFAHKAAYQIKTTGAAETQLEMVKRLELGAQEHLRIVDRCNKRNIQFLSTPFDSLSLKFLVEVLDIPLIKIPSGEITNAPFLLEIARTGKPVFLSTGMSSLGEIEQALGVLAFGYLNLDGTPSAQSFREAYNSKEGRQLLDSRVVLLHCTTEYPAPYDDVNLRAMDTLHMAFSLPVGYSDHTQGVTVAIAAAARGAEVLEKHFTLDRSLPGPDHKASLEPHELKNMVIAVRNVELALGSSIKYATLSEFENRTVARRSIVAAKEIEVGEYFTLDNLAIKRPGDGLSPFLFWDLVGRKSSKHYRKDEALTSDVSDWKQ
jgi:N-acetylneuraminate synthase